MRARIGERNANAWQHTNRPDAGVELESIAKVDLRNDLGAVGIADVGVPHRTKENGVGRGRGAEHLVGQCDAGPQIQLGTGLVRLEPQP